MGPERQLPPIGATIFPMASSTLWNNICNHSGFFLSYRTLVVFSQNPKPTSIPNHMHRKIRPSQTLDSKPEVIEPSTANSKSLKKPKPHGNPKPPHHSTTPKTSHKTVKSTLPNLS